jgi:6-phosphogluconolactonase
MDYIICDDPATLACRSADIVESELASGDRVALGLAGGSTPRATYEALAERDIDWSHTAAWMTDERWVPPMHPDANQRMIREALAASTGVQFLRPDTTMRSPTDAAARFTDVLTSVLATVTRRVTLLGIGTDGHTASLFPDTTALESGGPRYVANFVPDLDAWRLTATVELLSASDVVVFLVTGSAKAKIVASIAAGTDVPAARVEARERVLWLLDEDAAAELGKSARS